MPARAPVACLAALALLLAAIQALTWAGAAPPPGPDEAVLRSAPAGAAVALVDRAGRRLELGRSPLLLRLLPAGRLQVRDRRGRLRVELSPSPAGVQASPPGLAFDQPAFELSLAGYAPARQPLGDGQRLVYVTLRNPLPLEPVLGVLSPLVARPWGAAALALGAAALGLHLWGRRQARRRQEALEEQAYVGPGGRVGAYRLERLLGQGGMAEVFLGRPLAGGGPVAVKVLFEEVSRSPELRQRFQREVDICRGLRHPHLVGVHDWGEQNGRLYLVMDYVEGGSLRQLIPPGGMEPEKVRQMGLALAEALAAAHEQGVVHRDLKPENVLVDGQGRLRVADFGLARGEKYPTITATEATLGTPAYMPPEQVTGGRGDARADLYSLGCMLYEMLAGSPPFVAGDPVQVIVMHLSQPPEPLATRRPGVPPELEAVVMRLLEKEPERRFPSARALAQALRG
jgi:tRNA A-37 threonylcarbamoyl transferase component Bud32